jgi:hypothetical protein
VEFAMSKPNRFDEICDRTRAEADRLKAFAERWGLSLREAGKLLGLSSLYVSAILIGIACRQLELLQAEATRRR